MPQPLLILLYAVCFLLSLPLHAPRCVAAASPPISFSFDFTNKTSYNAQDLLVQGDAHVGSSMVDLTCNSLDASKMHNCVGRVSYGRPVPFYDTATGEVASFDTRFTFGITLVPRRNKGDGMTFFLASYTSVLPLDSYGGAFALMSGRAWQAYGENRFVAVEFDTYNNTDFEPGQTMDHIGIDINSVKHSVNTTNLPNYSLNGTLTASINFNGTTRMLVARLHFNDRPSMKPVEVSAQLPQLDTLLPPEVAVGFSAATGTGMELHQILSWSFNSTLAPKELPKSIGTRLIAAAIAGGACSFLLVIWFILSWFMSKRGRNSLMVLGAGPRQFKYKDLANTTNNFSSDRKLGEGAFGAVYRGTSFKVDNDGDEQEVAIKELLKGSRDGIKDFLAELNTISKTKHKNLVRLEGWCCYSGRSRWNWMCWCCSQKQLDDHKLFLIYELMPQGDLDHHLHKKDVALPWPARYKIVKGIGSALVYLHHECEAYILHRDIKPGNILLDDDFNAKIADFGLSRIANKNKSTLVTTAMGTDEYMDPKLKIHGDVKFDRRSDVYSFGLVLLEIACGRHNSRNEVWDLYRRYQGEEMKMVEAAADKKLGGDFHRDQMHRVLVVGLSCSLADGAERPSMKQAVRLLEHDELPDLNSCSTTTTSTS